MEIEGKDKTTFDLILLFGPDEIIKQDYISSCTLFGNIEVIRPQDIYKSHPEYGLRDIAVMVVAALKNRKCVVLTDELRAQATRNSLLKAVLKKVSCRVKLVQVVPKHGFMQVMWSRQFAHAEGSSPAELLEEKHLRQWFDSNMQQIDFTSGFVDKPTESEGFAVETVSVPLKMKTHYEVDLPALFFQWQSLVTEHHQLHPQVEPLCRRWLATHSWGRIFVIHDGDHDTGGLPPMFKDLMTTLASKMTAPVYAISVHTPSSLGNFCLPPQPGILAFLQRHHVLNLHSKNTCYVFSTLSHMKMAETAGVRHINISALKSPDTILQGQGRIPPVPAMLKYMVVEKLGSGTDHSPPVPLFDKCDTMKDGHTSFKCANGLEEHVFVRDLHSFSLYRDQCVQYLTRSVQRETNTGPSPDSPVSDPHGGKMAAATHSKLSSDPNWSVAPHRMKRKVAGLDSEDEQRQTNIVGHRNDHKTASTYSKWSARTIYVMSEQEMVEMAQLVLNQTGEKGAETSAECRTAHEENPG